MNKQADRYRDIGTGSGDTESGTGGISQRISRTFDSFTNPNYRLYYGAMAGNWFGVHSQGITRSLLIYRITGSGAILGLMSLAHATPMIILSLLGGAIADRVQKKFVLLAGQASEACIVLGVAIALTTGYLGPANPESWWILMVSALLHGTIMGLMMPSRQALIPELVSEKQITNAVSLNNLGMNSFQFVVPALAGFLVDALNFASVYYIMTFMYLMAMVCASLLPRTRTMTALRSNPLRDILEGLRYIRRETTILLLLAMGLFGMILGMPFRQLMPMFTEDILKVGATGMGILMSFSGLGAIVGSLVLASLPNRNRGKILLLSGLLGSLVLAAFSFSHWWYLSIVLITLVGLGHTGQMTLGNSLIQYYVDANYRGRVMSFLMMGIGFISIGTFLAGVLAELVGVQWSIGGMAMILTLFSLILLIITPRIRRLD